MLPYFGVYVQLFKMPCDKAMQGCQSDKVTRKLYVTGSAEEIVPTKHAARPKPPRATKQCQRVKCRSLITPSLGNAKVASRILHCLPRRLAELTR